jgi:hypothetical protein
MSFPFLIFWVIIFVARGELGWRGAAISVGIWLGLFLAFWFADVSPYLWVVAQALLDCVLILVAFRGDIRIN